MKKVTLLFIALLCTFNVHSANTQKNTIDATKFYFGGGLGLNSISGVALDDALGFQLFAGYQLPVAIGDGSLSVEVGYMDSGNFDSNTPFPVNVSRDATGLWSTAVVDLPINTGINLIGRAGFDFGDDDGLMIGGGLGFALNQKMSLRVEYVIRDNIDSLQLNFVIRQ